MHLQIGGKGEQNTKDVVRLLFSTSLHSTSLDPRTFGSTLLHLRPAPCRATDTAVCIFLLASCGLAFCIRVLTLSRFAFSRDLYFLRRR